MEKIKHKITSENVNYKMIIDYLSEFYNNEEIGKIFNTYQRYFFLIKII